MNALRNVLFMPANNPAMLLKCPRFGADGLALDLEDGVSLTEKDAARRLLIAHLKTMDFGKAALIVRVNGADTEFFEKDIAAVAPMKIDLMIVPKIESAADVERVIASIERYENKNTPPIPILPILETPVGVLHAEEIAFSSKRVWGLSFGIADYTSALNISISKSGEETLFAKSIIANAASAAGIKAIDGPSLEIEDGEVIRQDSLHSRSLGYTGKVCINPRQIPYVNEAMTPTAKEVRYARRVIEAMEESVKKGSGVFALDGKMVDRPVVLRAQRVLEMASQLGLSEEDEQ
jgi:citrate lyase subunit beta/citryl-CoA lyase